MTLQISLQQQFDHHRAATWDLRFSPDGQRLVSSDGQGVYFWQLNTQGRWEDERSLPIVKAGLPRFAADGSLLAYRTHKQSIHLIRLDGSEVASLPAPSQATYAWSPNQRWMVSGDTTRHLLLWNLHTGQQSRIGLPFPGFDDETWSHKSDLSQETPSWFTFTPDGTRLIFGASSEQGYVQVFHFDPLQRGVFPQQTLPSRTMIWQAVSPDGSMLAIVHYYEITIYDLHSFQHLCTIPRVAKDLFYTGIVFSPDSRFLASSKDDGTVDIWSLANFERITTFVAHPSLNDPAFFPIGGIDWSSTGLIATGGAGSFEDDPLLDDYTVKLWKVEEVEGV